ncbi:hypothetical protein IFR05_004134 [Cadophora sp. M221]|nr:hypothetical protein IFR05_004134 [Cadophora sp. M221]
MSFGSSVGDIILLIQLAHKNYRNCKEAGGEYIEIAREVRSLHSVLRTVRDEAERKDSLIFNAGPGKTKELTEIADGCKGVLEGIDALLTKYHGLAPDSTEVGKATKLWQRFRFGTEIEDLGKLRWKIITYTSTLAVLVDSINLKATERVGDIAGRIENQMETGFAEMHDRLERFEDMRKAVLFIATRARASQRYQAMESVLSLSTYADDDKEVWRQFRSQLVSLGFKSDSLDRHMEVLKAYMMKLDQTGVLDEAVEQSATTTQSWCGNASFRMTNLSLLGTVEGDKSGPNDRVGDDQSQENAVTSGYIPQQQRQVSQGDYQQTAYNQAPPSLLASSGDRNLKKEADPRSPGTETLLETATTRRRRIPRIKVDQPSNIEDSADPRTAKVSSLDVSSIEKDNFQITISEVTEVDVGSKIDTSEPRQPRPYAESYYSVSEAATSQSTLLRETTGDKKSNSASTRPQQPIRPISWSGPDVGKQKSRYQPRSEQINDGSDSESTVGKTRSTIRSNKRGDRSTVGSEEKVDDWLKLPGQPKRTRASSSPTRHKPMSRSNEELYIGGGQAYGERNRPSSSASNSRKNVKFEEGAKPPNTSQAKSSFAGSKASYDIPFEYKGRSRSRSRAVTVNSKDVPSQFQQAAKAALLAGATEAFRVRKENGSWSGEKGKRILTAAIGAGSIGATKDPGLRQGENSKRHILEAVVGGLAGNRVLNDQRAERDRRRMASRVVESDSESDSASDSDLSVPGGAGSRSRSRSHFQGRTASRRTSQI